MYVACGTKIARIAEEFVCINPDKTSENLVGLDKIPTMSPCLEGDDFCLFETLNIVEIPKVSFPQFGDVVNKAGSPSLQTTCKVWTNQYRIEGNEAFDGQVY